MVKSSIVYTHDLVKVYNPEGPNRLEVLRGIQLDVHTGEFVSIIGQSGSGKSTLLNILGALDVKTSGVLRIDGVDVDQLNANGLAELRGKTIGFVFQAHYLLDEFSCLENALLPIMIQKGRPSSEDVRRVTALLDRVGLSSELHKPPSQMSGGQQQRTAIIRALANQPRLILADEPTGNLDSRSGQEVFSLMREMARETGVAFMMVTHDDRLAAAADRVLEISDGLIHEIQLEAAR